MPTSWLHTISRKRAFKTKPGQQLLSRSPSNKESSARQKPFPLTKTRIQQHPHARGAQKEPTLSLALGKHSLLLSQQWALTDKTHITRQSQEETHHSKSPCSPPVEQDLRTTAQPSPTHPSPPLHPCADPRAGHRLPLQELQQL